MKADNRNDEQLELVLTAGPWPFVTRRQYRRRDGSHHVWHSRSHRKDLPGGEAAGPAGPGSGPFRWLWAPAKLNWWIGIVFALGSALFTLGSLLILVPGLAEHWSYSEMQVNAVFFAGSIPFTTAAYLQLFQAANAGEFPER